MEKQIGFGKRFAMHAMKFISLIATTIENYVCLPYVICSQQQIASMSYRILLSPSIRYIKSTMIRVCMNGQLQAHVIALNAYKPGKKCAINIMK